MSDTKLILGFIAIIIGVILGVIVTNNKIKQKKVELPILIISFIIFCGGVFGTLRGALETKESFDTRVNAAIESNYEIYLDGYKMDTEDTDNFDPSKYHVKIDDENRKLFFTNRPN